MWIFLNDAFVSIVKPGPTYPPRVQEEKLLVRARRREDLERLVHDRAIKTRIRETPTSDYRFRILLDRGLVQAILVERIANIDYGNFKASVRENDRHDVYARVWSAHYGLDRAVARRPETLYAHDDAYFGDEQLVFDDGTPWEVDG